MRKIAGSLFRCYRTLNELRNSLTDPHAVREVETAMGHVQTAGEELIRLRYPNLKKEDES